MPTGDVDSSQQVPETIQPETRDATSVSRLARPGANLLNKLCARARPPHRHVVVVYKTNGPLPLTQKLCADTTQIDIYHRLIINASHTLAERLAP